MTRKIGHQTYQVSPGVIVQPIYGAGEKMSGWQIVANGEYVDDYATKREAVAAAASIKGAN